LKQLSYYVILWNFTEQGIKNLKDCLKSIHIFGGYVERRYGAERYHGTFFSFFGQYDAVSLVEYEDEPAIRQDLLRAEKQGNVRSTTLKCISDEEANRLADMEL
jgi:uncharacterized protein with GYD domain